MRPFQWRALVRNCIAFYDKRDWDWIGAVGYICHCALGESGRMQREAEALKHAFRGIRYKEKP